MENHAALLENLCRMCGNKVLLKKGYVNAKTCYDYVDILQTFYGILESEDREVYPSKLCITCKHCLDKVAKNNKAPISTDTFAFVPHENDTCNICYKEVSHSRHATSVHVKYFDRILSNHGLIHHTDAPPTSDRVYYKLGDSNDLTNIMFSLRIHKDMTWSVYALNELTVKIGLLSTLPAKLTDDNIEDFGSKLNAAKLCTGNKGFENILKRRIDFKEPFPDTESGRAALAESSKGNCKLIKENFDIVRSASCQVLASEEICEPCKIFRKKLSKYTTRTSDIESKRDSISSDTSTTNTKYLTTDELKERLKNAQTAKRKALQSVAKLSLKIQDIVSKDSVDPETVTKDQHAIFKDILSSKTPGFEEGTPQWLLWNQQCEQASKKDSRAMKWHPLIIRWCLSIYLISPAAYKHLNSKNNRFMVLPHINTLKKYINFTKPASGFKIDIVTKLVNESKLSTLGSFEKNVALSFDEIKIKAGIVYKRGSGKIVGFTEMGELNDEIKHLVNRCNEEEVENETQVPVRQDFARYVNVFLVRGLFTKLCSPFGYHASLGFTASQLVPIVWEATRILEAVGFKVRSWTCDGASPNRKFFKLNRIDENAFYHAYNPFDADRDIYFVSDAPHLLKTTRNNLENSHGNINSRNLMKNGHAISWNHVVNVYEWDLGLNRMAVGLRMIPKVKHEHIRLKPQARMKVKYAAQVISDSMAKAMEMEGKVETRETIKFIHIFDRAFDCLNVMRKFGETKPDRQPYYNENDERFEFLESVVSYLEDWKNELENVNGITQEERNRMFISLQTYDGWKITISSFVSLAKMMLKEEGAEYLLSEKFSQDPLEEHFSRHRRIAGCNDNPTLAQFQQQETALNVIDGELISDLRGNTQGRQTNRNPIDITDMRLPKKKTT